MSVTGPRGWGRRDWLLMAVIVALLVIAVVVGGNDPIPPERFRR